MISKDKGYNRIWETKFGPRQYNRKSSLQHYRRTGSFKFVQSGEGHSAGEKWGDKKRIDPKSKITKYSKNSPSFDEGVFISKRKRQAKEEALNNIK